MSRYVPRLLEGRLRKSLQTFPAVLVVGPRQAGKSTLAKYSLKGWRHLDLERQADFAAVATDIEGFLDANPDSVAIDEAQRLPDLFPALRYAIDQKRTPGRFVLLGSASPPLLRTAAESLAGRLATLELTPFLPSELRDSPASSERWFWGGFPPLFDLAETGQRTEWLASYISAFLERDLPSLGVRIPPRRLRTLWTMLTHVHGNVLNSSDLARSLGISVPTVQDHLDILEASFMVRRLQPFFANIQKRLTRAPKAYIRDSGVLHHLAGLREPVELDTWHRRGASFEGLVIEELTGAASSGLVRPEFFYWRTRAGAEVDLLVVDGTRIFPFEIKLGSAVDTRSLAGLRQCMKDLELERGWVISTAKEAATLGGNIEILPWSGIVSGSARLPWEAT